MYTPANVGLSEVMHHWITELDSSYEKLRGMHGDLEHVNRESSEFKQVAAEFDAVSRQIFALKAVWYEFEVSCRMANTKGER